VCEETKKRKAQAGFISPKRREMENRSPRYLGRKEEKEDGEDECGKRMFPVRTHQGAVARRVSAKQELRRTVLSCLLWEDTFFEKGNEVARRIAELVTRNKAEDVAALAREARDEMQLRHVPLFLTRELARRKGAGRLVAETLEHAIQRADELGEFVRSTGKRARSRCRRG
jgi:hypothetical protein